MPEIIKTKIRNQNVEKKYKKSTEKKGNKIIATFDTNSIIYSIQNKINIINKIEEYIVGTNAEIIVFSGIFKELEKVSKSKNSSSKEKINARISIHLLKNLERQNKIKIKNAEPPLDRHFINLAKSTKLIILTHDKKLRKYLKQLGAKVITLN